MRLGRLTARAVDWQHVLRAGRHGNDAIHRGPQDHMIARLGQGLSPTHRSVSCDRDIHPQVQRARTFGRFKPDPPHRGMQVVSAVVVILGAAEESVAVVVAGRDRRVVASRRGVFLDHHDRAPPVRDQRIPPCRATACPASGACVRSTGIPSDPRR